MKATLSTPSNRTAYSCLRCSERKVKCDRQDPCNACTKHNAQCIFRPVPQSQKKQRRLKREALIDRLEQYEAVLKKQGLDPGAFAHPEVDQVLASNEKEILQNESYQQLLTPSSVTSESITSLGKSRILSDSKRVKFVDNLMARIAEEFEDSKEDPHESSHEESDDKEYGDTFDLVTGTSSRSNSQYMHPSTDQILELWRVFTENVDPLTKIVHVPSLLPAITKAAQNVRSISRGFNTLMFATYSTAILSLNDNECQTHFSSTRDDLLKRYVTATKVALARADFTSTTSIVVLQALVLHILSIRDTSNPRSIWTLIGMAIRIAQGIGLHRDANSFGFPPFEAEIRRRIWCFLRMLDNRAADMCGQPKFQGVETDSNMTRALANINDDDIYPGMPSPVSPSSKPTDMIFCAVQSECFAFAVQMATTNRKHSRFDNTTDDFASRESVMPSDEVIQLMEDTIETKYLRSCDPSDPLQLMTILFARYCMSTSRFMAHHPRKWEGRDDVPESERIYVWNVSIKLMEQFAMIQSSNHLQHFAWNFAYYMQWWAFIHILESLRTDPLNPDKSKAWRLVESTFQNNPRIITDTKRTLYVAVGNLCLKAFGAREMALANADSAPAQIPEFIHKLRQEREAARSRARKKAAWRTQQGDYLPSTHGTENQPHSTTRRLPHGHLATEQIMVPLQPQLAPDGEVLLPPEANATDTGWPFDDFNLSGLDTPGSLLDTSFMLTSTSGSVQGQNFDADPIVQPGIDWTQWDTWLGGAEF